jgi:hypothetical protein
VVDMEALAAILTPVDMPAPRNQRDSPRGKHSVNRFPSRIQVSAK